MICLEGKPSSGKHYSLPFLPATPSSPSRTLEGLFELTWCPSQALASPRALLPELQRYKDTIRCGALGAEVPGHRQLTQTLIVRLLKTHFLQRSLILKSQQDRNELVTRPAPLQPLQPAQTGLWPGGAEEGERPARLAAPVEAGRGAAAPAAVAAAVAPAARQGALASARAIPAPRAAPQLRRLTRRNGTSRT